MAVAILARVLRRQGTMKLWSRFLWMLLCVLLVAKSSVGAILAIADIPAFGSLVTDPCPLVAPADDTASRSGGAGDLVAQSASNEGSFGVALPPHHHHNCSTHCLMPGLVTAPMAVIAASRSWVPATTLAVPTSFAAAPPVHPPRARG